MVYLVEMKQIFKQICTFKQAIKQKEKKLI